MENEIIRRLEDGLVAAEDEVDLLKVRRQVQEIVWIGRLNKKEAERILKAIDYKLDRVRYNGGEEKSLPKGGSWNDEGRDSHSTIPRYPTRSSGMLARDQ